MKQYLVAASMLVLIGGGCGAAQEPQNINTPEPVATDTTTGGTTQSASVPEPPAESELLPKDSQWNQVQIRNFGNAFAVEIHPWWHWDGTSASLKKEGALFANSRNLLFGGNPEGSQYRIVLKSEQNENVTSLEEAAKEQNITDCEPTQNVDDFQVCLGASRGVAVYHDGTHQWNVTLTHASDEKGQGYFLHMLESFAKVESE